MIFKNIKGARKIDLRYMYFYITNFSYRWEKNLPSQVLSGKKTKTTFGINPGNLHFLIPNP